MLKILAAFVLVISGCVASDTCREFINKECTFENAPKEFPETKAELLAVCDPAIEFFNCIVEQGEKCTEPTIQDTAEIQSIASHVLPVFQEICDTDNLLHAAVVDNLECFSEFANRKHGKKCNKVYNLSPEKMMDFAKALAEEGLLELTDNSTYEDYMCFYPYLHHACFATEIEENCSTVAMEVYIDVVIKLGPALDGPRIGVCENAKELFPAFIRLYKAKRANEELDIVSNIFEERK